MDPTNQLGAPRSYTRLFLEGIVLFAILWGMRKKSEFEGFFISIYIAGYGLYIHRVFRERDTTRVRSSAPSAWDNCCASSGWAADWLFIFTEEKFAGLHEPQGERNPADRSRADRAINPARLVHPVAPTSYESRGTCRMRGLALPCQVAPGWGGRGVDNSSSRMILILRRKSDLGIDPLHSLFESEGQWASVTLQSLTGNVKFRPITHPLTSNFLFREFLFLDSFYAA